MTVRTAIRIAAALLAFLLLSASDCGGLTFSDIVTGHSATITAKNNSEETVTVLLYADDASNTGSVNPHGSPTITTHIDGIYTVVVVGQGADLTTWDSRLHELRSKTEEFYKALKSGAEANFGQTVQSILQAKVALADMQKATVVLASCNGRIKFPTEIAPSPRPLEFEASITKAASGTWAATCPGT